MRAAFASIYNITIWCRQYVKDSTLNAKFSRVSFTCSTSWRQEKSWNQSSIPSGKNVFPTLCCCDLCRSAAIHITCTYAVKCTRVSEEVVDVKVLLYYRLHVGGEVSGHWSAAAVWAVVTSHKKHAQVLHGNTASLNVPLSRNGEKSAKKDVVEEVRGWRKTISLCI